MGRSDYGRGEAKGKAKAAAKEQDKGDSKKGASKKDDPKVKETPSKEKDKDASKASKDAKKPEKEAPVDNGPAKLLEEAQQKFADDEREEKARAELRVANRQVRAAGWGQLNGARDKSIVKVQKFQNKLKLFKGEADLQTVLSDVDGVDASKYVPELAECLMEAAGVTLKLKELGAASKVCSKLHATYEEFSALLAKALDKAFHATPPSDVNRRRFLLRMCAELSLVECIPANSTNIVDMVKELCDISLPEEQLVINFTILGSLVQKHAVSCLNVVPAKQKSYEEALGKSWVVRECVLIDAQRAQLTQLIINAYQSAGAGLLQNAHTSLLEQEKVNQKLRIDKGAVDEENDKKYQALKENYTKIQTNITTLSENLNQPIPTMQEETPETSRLGAPETKEVVVEKEEELPPLWEDSEQQRFFEDVTDLKDVIPAVLLSSGKDKESSSKDEEEERSKLVKKEDKNASSKEEVQSGASDFELFLIRVGNAESAKSIDDLIIEFFHEYNTKGKRSQLAQQLFNVSRNSLHLLAPHARFIAIVAPYLKEVPNYVMEGLKAELEKLLSEKSPTSIDSYIRTVRYLCELCKFKICPQGVILDTFNTLLEKFSALDAELVANVLQSCGRFLLYTPETATRTENLLERMMRLKNAKSLGLRLEIMIEDSYYTVKPPEGKRSKVKEKEPLELFVEDLVFQRLYEDDDEDKVLKLVRKLPWSGVAPGLLKKCFLELNLHANYDNIYKIASLLAGLARYRDTFVIDVIDALFESIQTTIERNDFREMPLRVRQAKLVGELYNYMLIDSNLVFDAMYHYIGFGGPSAARASHKDTAVKIYEHCLAMKKGNLGVIAEESGGNEDSSSGQLPTIFADPQHPLEAPWDFFRIKLVCVILDTCGHYFDRGAVKQKLDRFLHFFFRYILSKGEVPMRVMFMVHDTLERARPKLTIPSKTEADEAVMKILNSERDTLDLEGDGEGEQDDSEDSSEEDESSSDSDSDDDSEGSESEDEEESSSDDSDDDNEEYSRGAKESQQSQAEVDEFEKEVQQILLESFERERRAPRPNSELPAPPPLQKRPDAAAGGVPGMFSLMSKQRGGAGKIIMKQIEVPEDSKLTRVAKAEGVSESQESEEIKRKTKELALMGGGTSSQPSQRFGKGYGKGKKQRDFMSEFLPNDEDDPILEPTMRVRIVPARGKGKGRGSSGSTGNPQSGSSGGQQPGVRSSGGGRTRPDQRGTPSTPGVKGSF